MWWSQGIGGRNALDYLIKVQGLSLYEAVDRILGKSFSIPNVSKPPPEIKTKVLELPQKADNNDRAIEYLSRRGISKTVIDYCIENGLIYQSKAYENVVFVGYDRNNAARYAAVRSTDKSGFKGDVSGSDKTFSFRFDKGDGDTLHVFEGAIDLLSYATLAEEPGLDFKGLNLVSLSGVSLSKSSNIPVPMKSFLDTHDSIKTIHLHLDKDKAGRKAVNALTEILSPVFEVKSSFVPIGKDMNDYLCYTKNLPFKSYKEGRDAR